MSGAKKSRGRQKIEIKKMSNESNLQVTFSKRRSGLFKKASELCTLCGADVAIVVFSPGDKVFSFGHPNVDAVIDRYLARGPATDSGTMQFFEAHRMAHVRELNSQLTHVNNQLDDEKKRVEELNLAKKEAQSRMWWARPINGMNMAQVQQFKAALEEMKKQVAHLSERARLQSSATNPNPIPHEFFPAGSNSNLNVHQPQPLQPQVQVFPPHLIQPSMLQNLMYHDGSMSMNMMRHMSNMGMGGGYGPAAGFF